MLPQKKVLVVEDNELNREILCDILSPEYAVLQAENGQAALDVLKENGESISDFIGYCHAGYGWIQFSFPYEREFCVFSNSCNRYYTE